MDHSLIIFILGCIFAGVFSGLTSGLLGLGGGLVIVPALNYLIPIAYPNLPEAYILPISIQTSFAIIIFNTFTAAMRQIKLNNVDFDAVKFIAPALIISSALVGLFVTGLNPGYLKVFFGGVVVYMSYVMIAGRNKLDFPTGQEINTPIKSIVAGTVIGGISATAGISGGGFLTPFFNEICRFPIKRALGTSSACGFFIAVTSTIAYFISGIQKGISITGLPLTYGYFNLISFLSFMVTSVFFASYGVKLQSVLPAPKVKKIFALFLILVAIDMIFSGLKLLMQ